MLEQQPRRHFPPPWFVEEGGECFCVKDGRGQALAYIYYEEVAGRRDVVNRLTRDEARRIAANIARLPEMIAKTKPAAP